MSPLDTRHESEPPAAHESRISRRQLLQMGIGGLLGVLAGLVHGSRQQRSPAVSPGADVADATPSALPQHSAAPASSQALVRPATAVPTAEPSAVAAQPATPAPSATGTATPAAAPPPETVAGEAPSAGSTTTTAQIVLKPPIITRAEWGAARPSGAFVAQQPQFITLHHEGVIFSDTRSAPEYLQRVQHWSMTNRRWPDIPYHFMIDRAGNVYEGRPLEAQGDTNTDYDLQHHALIAVLGKYDAGEQQPYAAQIESIIALMAWITDTYAISLDSIQGHRDYIPLNRQGLHIDPRTGEKITCPGDNLYRYLLDGSIRNGIAQRLAQAQRPYHQPQAHEHKE